jgi:hypothetical protein
VLQPEPRTLNLLISIGPPQVSMAKLAEDWLWEHYDRPTNIQYTTLYPGNVRTNVIRNSIPGTLARGGMGQDAQFDEMTFLDHHTLWLHPGTRALLRCHANHSADQQRKQLRAFAVNCTAVVLCKA